MNLKKTNKMWLIIKFDKKIEILLGEIRTKIDKNTFLINPV